MKRDQVIAVLRAHEGELRRRGVAHAALFGSAARGQARADSDLDIMVDIDPNARVGVWGFAGISRFIGDLFSVPVDVVERAALIDRVRRTAERDAVNAF